MDNCSVSVIIVNWNHQSFLQTCLDSIFAQGFKPLNVVVVDNASLDGSPDWIVMNYPQVRLISFGENRGFSFAFNQGVRATVDPFILSLNPDVVLQPECLVQMVRVMIEQERIGVVAPKLLQADNPSLIDSTGLFINRSRCPYDRGQGEVDHGQYDHTTEIFGACGAAALYRRAMLEDLAFANEYFDEDFFAYYEDADLAWRAQLSGWRAVYEPLAIGIHVRGWGDSLRKQRKRNPMGPRLAFRNRYLMSLKNDRLSNFLGDLPFLLASELPKLLYAALTMPSVILGALDFVALSGTIMRKRRRLWQKAGVKESKLRPWFIQSQDIV